MAGRINEVPEGFQTVTLRLIVTDIARAIDSYGVDFWEEELFPVGGLDGKVGRH